MGKAYYCFRLYIINYKYFHKSILNYRKAVLRENTILAGIVCSNTLQAGKQRQFLTCPEMSPKVFKPENGLGVGEPHLCPLQQQIL